MFQADESQSSLLHKRRQFTRCTTPSDEIQPRSFSARTRFEFELIHFCNSTLHLKSAKHPKSLTWPLIFSTVELFWTRRFCWCLDNLYNVRYRNGLLCASLIKSGYGRKSRGGFHLWRPCGMHNPIVIFTFTPIIGCLTTRLKSPFIQLCAKFSAFSQR